MRSGNDTGAALGPGEREERLPRGELLRGKDAFRLVYDEGTARRGPHLVTIVHRAPGATRRAGFVTSRKVGRAVERNRARRLMREAWRRLRGSMNGDGGHAHVVFVARRKMVAATMDVVLAEMRGHLRAAGVIDDAGNTLDGDDQPRR